MKTFCMLPLILIVGISFGQNPTFKYSGDEFPPSTSAYLSHHQKLREYIACYFIKNRFDFHNKLCARGIVYVKFRVGPKGISEIACTGNTPDTLASGLKEAVRSSEKYWTAKKMKGRVMLMPVIYDYKKSGCTSETQSLDAFSKKLDEFDDGTNVHNESYILLDPMVTMSGIEHKF